MPGTLYLVATPIGNLADITHRALQVLKDADLIACEDTRHTRKLLNHFGIGTATISYHEHNEQDRAEELCELLESGKNVALVSDAGTPLISDPGFRIVKAAAEREISVVPIPGVSAVTTALSASGIPTDQFLFAGFLPARIGARRAKLNQLRETPATLVFYEAPHRLIEVLRDMTRILGAQRSASISRELTKRFETTYSGTLAQLSEAAERDSDMSRGEIVIVVSGAPATSTALELDSDALLRALLEELSPSQAAKVAAHVTGLKRSDLYEAALRLGK